MCYVFPISNIAMLIVKRAEKTLNQILKINIERSLEKPHSYDFQKLQKHTGSFYHRVYKHPHFNI